MKGYKAFSHGMVCRGKQYAENTTFEEDAAVMCKKGMHFCADPLDCLRYYDLVDDDGNIVEIAEVECADEDAIADGSKTKFVTKKLKIKRKLSFDEWVEALRVSVDNRHLVGSWFCSTLASSGDGNCIASSYGCSRLSASGHNSSIAASGLNSRIAASGDRSRLVISGVNGRIAASGDRSRLVSIWDGSCLVSSGDVNRLAVRENSIAAAVGAYSRVKAGVGSWIVLAEWKDEKPKCVKAAMIDGEALKPDVWYELKNGEIVPAEYN